MQLHRSGEMPATTTILTHIFLPIVVFAGVTDYFYRIVPVRLWVAWLSAAVPTILYSVIVSGVSAWHIVVASVCIVAFVLAKFNMWGGGDTFALVCSATALPTIADIGVLFMLLGAGYIITMVGVLRHNDGTTHTRVPVVPFLAVAFLAVYIGNYM
ncbi:MAG: hypothetical protein WC489_07950 [Patescibacteria group bacterium]